MDTSDSEYFESADEDIPSDGDAKTEGKHEKSLKKKDTSSPKSNVKELKEKDENLEKNNDNSKSIKTQNTDEPEPPTECHLIPKVQDLDINSQSSTSHKQEIQNVEPLKQKPEHLKSTQNTGEISSEKPKNQKVNPKFKLGSKTTTKIEQLEAPLDYEVPKTVDKSETTCETKKMDKKVESTQVEEENLWDDEELDWGAEAEAESNTVSHPSPSANHINKRINEETVEQDSWASWSNWGVSVLSSATQSVSSITNQISNVIENGIGAVDPEELARIEKEEKKIIKEESRQKQETTECSESSYGNFGLGNLVKLVENTGTKVISGGLDTLETIGKKTMEVLQEGDPGLKKKRAFLKIDQEKPVLSQILREAKEKAENELKTSEQTSTRKCKNYETLFDDHHGLVHLEALELLSKQCEIKLKNIQSTMTGDEFTDFSETMDQIKELCELPDEDEEEQLSIEEIKEKLEKAVEEMGLQINYEKLVANWQETEIWLSTLDLEICDEKELHQQAIETLAEMTSRAMEQFHKTGELLLIKDRRSTADEADSLVQITATLISLIGIVAAKFCEKLNTKLTSNKEVSALITNVFFEAANSSSYIQDALQLLIPVLQVGAV